MKLADIGGAKPLLILIILAGLAVRFYGINFGLILGSKPFLVPIFRPDEEYEWLKSFELFSGDLNPHFSQHPHLQIYALGLIYFLVFSAKALFLHVPFLSCYQSAANNPSALILISRLYVAFLGVLTIPVVYFIAKRLFDERVGLLSAFFLALAYPHVRDSHFGTLDVPVTFMICLAFLFLVRIYQQGGWKNHLLAGFVIGLAIATKYTPVVLVAPLYIIYNLRGRAEPEMNLGALFMIFLGFVLVNPFSLISPAEFISGFKYQLLTQDLQSYSGNYGRGWFYHLKFTLLHGLGIPFLIASFAGFIYIFRKSWPVALIILSFACPYYFFIGKGYLVFSRYLIPLIPFLCISAAFFVAEISAVFLKKGRIPVAIAVVLIAPSIYSVYWFDAVLARKDSRFIAGEWINENIPKNSSILKIGYIFSDIPNALYPRVTSGFQWPPVFFENKPPFIFNAEVIRPLSEAEIAFSKSAPRYEYVILDASPLEAFNPSPATFQYLDKYYDLITTINGVGSDTRMVFDRQDAFYVPFVNARFAQRPGPNFFIYKVKK